MTAPARPIAKAHRVADDRGIHVGAWEAGTVTPVNAPTLTGLTAAEVAERVARGQTNEVPDAPSRSTWGIIRANVLTPVNLIVAILASLVLLAGSPKDALFGALIVVNSIIGIIQELRAKWSLDALRVVSAPRAHVLRDGERLEIAVEQLVLDDLVELRAGMQVVADGEVLVTDNLEIDESLLTGEADPIDKQVGDRVMSGSAVVAGTGVVRLTGVGAENYAVKLAEEARKFTLVNSPLRNDVNKIIKLVGWAIIPVGILLASSQFLRLDQGWRTAVVKTVGGLIGMVPEGLVLMTSVAFAVGVVRLAKKRCLVQELPAIEVLARVDVLCADKTGTITEGALALSGAEPVGETAQSTIDDVLRAMATLDPDPNATLQAVRQAYGTTSAWSLTGRVPFSSARKWSSMAFADHGTWVFGAPENVLGAAYAGDLRQRIIGHATDGKRVLVLASSTATPSEGAELGEIQPAAIVLFEDIVRHDAPDTLRYFADQGVTLKVISGDNPVTVAAVARRAGLVGWDSNRDARDLPADMDGAEFANDVLATSVFGRVTPQQKRAMVRALQANGHTVAMTGDGVNDVLALKDADCGVAMASGSEASRGVAQLVLMDSNFAALPPVVAEGRRVINNIERVASLFLAKTTYSLILSLLAGVFAFTYPLRPIHLTLLSWFTIGIPAFVLALEPNAERVQVGFLSRVLHRAVPTGIVVAGMALAVFQITQLDSSIDEAQASSMAVLAAGSIGVLYLTRIAQPWNPVRIALVSAMAAGLALAFMVPFGRETFELPLTRPWAYALVAGAVALAYPLLLLGERIKLHRYAR